MLEEFWLFVFRGQPAAILRNPFFNTTLAVGLMLFFAFNSTIMSAWKIFGAGNQLIAALAMTVVTVWLLQRGKTFWFTLVPAIVMVITTFTTLILSLGNYRAPANSGHWIIPGQLPMASATLLLLVLSTGILIVALRKIISLQKARCAGTPALQK
jgi:carbon starvation protein CstA